MEEQLVQDQIKRKHLVLWMGVGVDGDPGVLVIPKQERNKGQDSATVLHLLMEEPNALDQIMKNLLAQWLVPGVVGDPGVPVIQ